MKTSKTPSNTPWYQHLWPWLVMIPPVLAVASGVAMIYLSNSSNDGLVSDNYYKDGLAVNEVLTEERIAVQLGIRGDISLLLKTGTVSDITVMLKVANAELLPNSLRLTFSHPTRANRDKVLLLNRHTLDAATVSYAGKIEGLKSLEHWIVILEDDLASWRLTVRLRMPPVGKLCHFHFAGGSAVSEAWTDLTCRQ